MCGSSCPKWSYLCSFTCAIPAHVPFQDGDESGHPRMSAFISVLKRDMCVFGTRRAGACALRERLRSPCVPIAHNQALHGVPIAHMRSGCEPDALLLATKSPPCSSLDARTLRRVRFSAGPASENKKAGRYCYLPARSFWWSRGESNSGPRKPPDRHLQAQSLV